MSRGELGRMPQKVMKKMTGTKVLEAPGDKPKPQFGVKELKTVVISMTQWEGSKINQFHAFFQETVCVNACEASEWNVLLCGRHLFNRTQKISFCWLYN